MTIGFEYMKFISMTIAYHHLINTSICFCFGVIKKDLNLIVSNSIKKNLNNLVNYNIYSYLYFTLYASLSPPKKKKRQTILSFIVH